MTSIRKATFANPLFLPVVFANSAKFIAEAFVKPVTANSDVVVATAGFPNPVRVTGAVGTGAVGTPDSSFLSALQTSQRKRSTWFLKLLMENSCLRLIIMNVIMNVL